MARMPIEVAVLDGTYTDQIAEAIKIANSQQSEFVFEESPDERKGVFALLDFSTLEKNFIIKQVADVKKALKGFWPYTMLIVRAELRNPKWTNLFSTSEPKRGISVISTRHVEEHIIPKGKMVSYFLYYFAAHVIKFIVLDKENHRESRGCIFDFKENKLDLLKSLNTGSICDDCRQELLAKETQMSGKQFESLSALFRLAGQYLRDEVDFRTLNGHSKEGERIKAVLDIEAEQSTRKTLLTLLGAYVLVWLLQALLILRFTWQVMEPIVYLVGGLIPIIGYIYFAITTRELTPGQIYESLKNQRRGQLHKKFGI